MNRRNRPGPKGFTMIELMIVVAIIGILAGIAIPKFIHMIEKSREGSTKGNMGSLKSATNIYYGDQEGVWPTTLNVTSRFRFSMYLDRIPEVKVTGKFDRNTGASVPKSRVVRMTGNNAVPTSKSSGWMYDSRNGKAYVNSTLKDSKKIPYSYYGFE